MLSRSCPIPLPSTMNLTAWNEGGDGRGWKGMGGDGRGWEAMGRQMGAMTMGHRHSSVVHLFC